MGITDEAEQHHPTIPNHWVHALTMPRELKYENGQIYQSPLQEMKMLRREKVEARLSIDGAEELYPQIAGKSIELLIELVET